MPERSAYNRRKPEIRREIEGVSNGWEEIGFALADRDGQGIDGEEGDARQAVARGEAWRKGQDAEAL
jgi:hypothetical protein